MAQFAVFVEELVARIVREDEGQDMVEYALMVGLLAVAAVVGLVAFGDKISGVWTKITNMLPA